MPTPKSIMDDALKYEKEIERCVWPFLKPHVDYWWCFDDNIQELRDGIRDLERQTLDIRKRIEKARLRPEIVRPWVEKWLEESPGKLVEARTALPNDNIPEAWKLISRYSMGKMAKKAAEKIANHRSGNFETISDPAPPASMASTSQTQTMDFESRKRNEEEIMESLRNNSVSTIAICGMAGIGKTTMAERIGKRAKEENLIDEIVTVVVGQQVDTLKIQKEIAVSLGLALNEDTVSARAHLLRTRLTDGKRKIIIFDDVGESLKLKDLGISVDSHFERCKILLTTRSKDIFREIENVKEIEIECLTQDESWSLFKEKVGGIIEENLQYNTVAKEIVKICDGLPIALIKSAQPLKARLKFVWKCFLSDLRGNSFPTNLSEVRASAYKALKQGYDCLGNENERKLFLLCCLFPENYNISVEQLIWYSMGLKMFGDNTSVEEAKNKTLTWVDNIIRRFLLIDVHQELHVKRQRLLHVKGQELYVEMPGLHVKMQNVVREVAIYIGSKEKDVFLKILNEMPITNSSDDQCHWMSVDISNEGKVFPVGFCFPKLRLLMLLKSIFSDISFQETEDLNVLSFQSTLIGSLPQRLGLVKKLQTLCLFHCQVENISVIGELTSLKILICCGCKNITELPEEIGGLNGLRLLELYECSKLQRIPFGIIRSLVRLEELKIRRSFSDWSLRGERRNTAVEEIRNAAVTELVSLHNLTCLEIEISDCNLAAEEMRFPENLDKYYISVGPEDNYDSQVGDYEKVMILNLPSDIHVVGQWILKQVMNTEYLSLEADGLNNLNIAEIENLRNLRFQSCPTVEQRLNAGYYNSGTAFRWLEFLNLRQLKTVCTIPSNSFSRLKELHVDDLPNLKHLWESPNLCKLESVKIVSCSNLVSVFTESGRCLLQLEVLKVQSCDKLEKVIRNENVSIEFPKLKKLKLRHLPNLTVFCQGVKTIKFPNLTKMLIGGLPNLNSFSPLNSETPHDDTTSFHFLCNPKVEMGSLKTLKLTDCSKDNIRNMWCRKILPNFFNNLVEIKIEEMNGIESLMSYPIAKSFVNLKSLCIDDCKVLVEVIKAPDASEVVGHMPLSLFPTLKKLSITKLLELRSFWSGRHSLELPLLEYVDIKQCPVMETFTFGFLETPKIRMIRVNNHQIDGQKDLNHVVHEYHVTSKQNHDEDNRDKNNNENGEDEDENDEAHLIQRRRK